MIKHYILTAWRSIVKNRLYSVIHLSGLVLAITTCLLLAAYLSNEYSFDRFHAKGDRIYRVNTDMKLPDQTMKLSLTSGLVGPHLKNDFPEVQSFVCLSQPWSDLTFRAGTQSYFEKKVLYADSSFFKQFDFQLLQGNPQTVLREPNNVVLTERLASKYFGNQNPMDQTINIDNQAYTVTGVAANPPDNSDIEFDALIAYGAWIQEHPPTEANWGWRPSTTFILLAPNTNAQQLAAKLNDWLQQKLPENQRATQMALGLEPLRNIHFDEPRLGEFKPKGNRKQMWLLALTGVFILLMAIFNYVNLATAVYASRTKEIGVRKTFGASKRQITFQFLSESVLLCSAAVIFSVFLANALLPIFSEQLKQTLVFDFLSPVVIGIALLTTILVIGPLAGFYPSFIVSRLQLAAIFQNRIGSGKLQLRRVLTGLQFMISIGLMLSTLIVWRQHQFLTNQSLGFSKDNKLIVRLGATNERSASPEAIKQELLKIPEVTGVSLSSHIPSENPHGVGTTIRKADGTEASAELELNLVDFDFIQLYGLKVIAGRAFSRDFMQQDTAGTLILTEAAMKQLGFSNPDEVIGRDFSQWDRSGKVIGVVADFNQHSLHDKISPVTFQVNPARFEKMTIEYQSGNLPNFTEKVRRTWQSLAGNVPFDYTFLDQQLALQYEAEQHFANIFMAFTLLAIFIACMGLYGLTAIAVVKRTKEIGIRKVLGASVGSIVTLFSKEFLYLVLVAAALAFPIAWWVMNRWLQDFAYRIPIQWWMFALVGIGALLIALLTVSLQAVRAAVVNPIESLRSE